MYERSRGYGGRDAGEPDYIEIDAQKIRDAQKNGNQAEANDRMKDFREKHGKSFSQNEDENDRKYYDQDRR